jgi:hypothetical protein
MKYPNFQKNMAVHFNNFQKDVDKLQSTHARGRGRGAGGDRRVARFERCAADEHSLLDESQAGNTNPDELFERGIEEGEDA